MSRFDPHNSHADPRNRALPGQVARADAARAAAIDRHRDECNYIPWHSTERIWCEANGERTPFSALSDQRVWDIVGWLVRTARKHFDAYADKNDVASAFGPDSWLCARPLFLALVVEAARRRITFPPDVFAVIDKYIDKSAVREVTEKTPPPWRDPELRKIQGATLDQIAETHGEAYEKEHRNIDLE
jgi:hypothetical protein